MGRKKTSIYLDEALVQRLAWLAEREGRPQAEIVREAIAVYDPRPPKRDFSFFDSGSGPGDSIADLDEDECFEGFGEDSMGE